MISNEVLETGRAGYKAGGGATAEIVELGPSVESVVPAGYHEAMSDAHDVVTNTGLSPEELEWLNERIAEYRELLAYLREH